jgi:hypothetical protein
MPGPPSLEEEEAAQVDQNGDWGEGGDEKHFGKGETVLCPNCFKEGYHAWNEAPGVGERLRCATCSTDFDTSEIRNLESEVYEAMKQAAARDEDDQEDTSSEGEEEILTAPEAEAADAAVEETVEEAPAAAAAPVPADPSNNQTEPELGNTKSAERGPAVHLKQAEVAEKLFSKIMAQLGPALDDFTKVVPIVLVPNLLSLFEQTVARMDEFFADYRAGRHSLLQGGQLRPQHAFYPNFGANGGRSVRNELVIKPDQKNKILQGADENSVLSKWIQRIKSEQKTLFFFVHDEAHWAATVTKREDDSWVSGGTDAWVNDEVVRTNKNVITLFVSATPYNLLTKSSQIPEKNVESWFAEDDVASEYYGLKKYRKKTKERAEAPADPAIRDPVPPGCIITDQEFENSLSYVGNATSRSEERTKLLINHYVSALKVAADPDGTPEQSMIITHAMMKDLLTSTPDGKGKMILIRVLSKDHGRQLATNFKEAREKFGLRDKFAVIVDVDATKDTLRKCVEPVFQKRMARWQGVSDVKAVPLKAYKDLSELPCILILCEKGKMGDTFPSSLRYYDLRLRYATSSRPHNSDAKYGFSRATAEQDLGRAFRYVKRGEEECVPTIVLGRAAYQSLGMERRSRRGDQLDMWKNPDLNMKCTNSRDNSRAMPNDEFDMAKYRCHYEPIPPKKENKKGAEAGVLTYRSGHFDSRSAIHDDWKDNPRRFLLVGLPQIGKTGSFLHLIYLLWLKVDDNIDGVVDSRNYDPGPQPERPQRQDHNNMGMFPSFSKMQALSWAENDYKECPEECPYKNKTQLNKHGNFGCELPLSCSQVCFIFWLTQFRLQVINIVRAMGNMETQK